MSTFLGRPVVGTPLHQDLVDRLTLVEQNLRATHANLATIDQLTGAPQSFEDWVGLKESPTCTGGGLHRTGRAIDLDVNRNPYIATRTGTSFGGENPGPNGVVLTSFQRSQVVAVYDRAADFLEQGVTARVGGRASNEPTADVWRRFAAVSDALTTYFAFCFRQFPAGSFLDRPPLAFLLGGLPFIDDVSPTFAGLANRVFVDNIPTAERLPRADAQQSIAAWLADRPDLQAKGDADFWYFRVLLDHEIVRIPMLSGTPGPVAPLRTRRPGNGFLSLRPHLVQALCDVGGLRWGACDFGAGENGDMMHFDLRH
ncbi:hypothetical protein [Umezawaea sp. NPDC059074]|uniref:hypothetical protein n=1 Tax=Umezawaea sp. NPDC059074 TaxID=3346716 RepID=UPI0036C859F3